MLRQCRGQEGESSSSTVAESDVVSSEWFGKIMQIEQIERDEMVVGMSHSSNWLID